MVGRYSTLEVARNKQENVLDEVLRLPPGVKEPLCEQVVFWQLCSYPYWQSRVGIQSVQ